MLKPIAFLLAYLMAFSPLFQAVGNAQSLASPYSISLYKSQVFTATGQTGPVIPLNGLTSGSSLVGSSFASATITVVGNALSTVTFAVMGSADNGATYNPLLISQQNTSTPTPALSATATTNGIYQVSLAGMTHIKIVTSGTFTAAAVTFSVAASPNASASRSGPSGAVTAAAIQAAIQPQTGCNNAGWVWIPSSNSCVALGTGVTSFNTRTGAVTLSTADVNAVGTISNSTTGNAATATNATSATNAQKATQLAATPSLCTSGQFPNGVDASGNAVNCAAPTAAPAGSTGNVQFKKSDGTQGGDPNFNTDGAGNIIPRSVNGIAQVNATYTFANAATAGFTHALSNVFGSNPNPCVISHGQRWGQNGDVSDCYTGRLPTLTRTFYPSYFAAQYDGSGCMDTNQGKSMGNQDHTQGAQWYVINCHVGSFFSSSAGIKENYLTGSVCTSVGDCGPRRNFDYCSNGFTGASDEGCKDNYFWYQENPAYYGVVATTTSAGPSSVYAPGGSICGTAQVGTGLCYGQYHWLIKPNSPLLQTRLLSFTSASFTADGTATISGTLTPNATWGKLAYTAISITANLTRAANGTVTASVVSGDASSMHYQNDTYLVSGCSDSTFNGSFTNSNTSGVIWSSTSTSAGTCNGATVKLTSLPDPVDFTVAAGQTDTIFVNTLSGTTAAFRASGIACISSVNAESVAYTSTAVSGGVQSLTFAHHFPQNVGATVSDGPCRVFTVDGDVAPNQFSHTAYVITNIPTSNTFTWSTVYAGSRSGAAFGSGATAYVSAAPVTSIPLTRVAGSNVVSMALNVNLNSTVAISACSDSSLNGTFTISSKTFTGAGSSNFVSGATTATSCTATVSVTGKDGITLWDAAFITATKDPSATPIITTNSDPRQSGWMGLGPNTLTFTAGEYIEATKVPATAFTMWDNYCSKFTQDGGGAQGLCHHDQMFGSLAAWQSLDLSEPLASFKDYGGSFSAPSLWNVNAVSGGGGVYSWMFNASTAPINGVINVGPSPGGIARPYRVFSGTGVGDITADPSGTGSLSINTYTLNLNASTINFANNIYSANGFTAGSGQGFTFDGYRLKKLGNTYNSTTGTYASIGYCANQYSTTVSVCFGPSNSMYGLADFDYFVTSEGIGLGKNSVYAESFHSTSSTAYNVYANIPGMAAAGYFAVTPPAGTGSYTVSYYAVPFSSSGIAGSALFSTRVTFSSAALPSSSNVYNIACNSSIGVALGSGTIHIIRSINYGNGGTTDLGICTTSIADSGQGTLVGTQDYHGSNGNFFGGVYTTYGLYGFSSSIGNIDSGFSRLGPNSIACGNGTIADVTCTLSLGNLIVGGGSTLPAYATYAVNTSLSGTAYFNHIYCNPGSGATVTLTLQAATVLGGQQWNITNVGLGTCAVSSSSNLGNTSSGVTQPLNIAAAASQQIDSDGTAWRFE